MSTHGLSAILGTIEVKLLASIDQRSASFYLASHDKSLPEHLLPDPYEYNVAVDGSLRNM